MPLTGGYRRTPVMQIGADVYCDSLSERDINVSVYFSCINGSELNTIKSNNFYI